jgi:Transposase DDE domain
MPYKLKDPVRHKFDKKSYNVRDWKKYDENLRNRGSLTIWFSEEAIASWNSVRPSKMKRGRQQKYSDLAIETAHTLRLVYKKPLRQTEGFLASIVRFMQVDLDIPDHTTLSRRAATVKLSKSSKPPKPLSSSGSNVVIVDSTGIRVFGEKEWMNLKHGTRLRKVWRKLHLAIDEDGEILSATITTHDESDTSQVAELLSKIESPIDEFIGDAGGYDHKTTYDALEARERTQGRPILAIIPPNLGFQKEQDSDSKHRKKNIKLLEDRGRARWQKATDYERRALAENTMHRYKAIMGNKLISRTPANQNTEIQIGVKILNKMNGLCRPKAQKAA